MTPRQDLANARLAELKVARTALLRKAYRAFADPHISSNPSDPTYVALMAEWDELETQLSQANEECRLANIEADSGVSNNEAKNNG